jgi:hypothetical protein
VNAVADINTATAIEATDQTKAAAGAVRSGRASTEGWCSPLRVGHSSQGFAIDHPDSELGERLMAEALGVADRDAMHGILRQLVKASVNRQEPRSTSPS